MSSSDFHKNRKISCKRCQRRKLKCSRTTPCTSCTRAGHECEYRQDDGRKIPVSKHYVASLEQQIASLQDALRHAQSNVSTTSDAAALNVSGLGEDPRISETEIHSRNDHREVRAGNILLDTPSQACLSYQGPTSIYRLGSLCDRRDATSEQQDRTPSLYCIINAEEPDVDEILRSFFRWQYHEYMFLYREAILLDYLNHEYQGRYCSLALIYSICALGSIPTSNPDHDDSDNNINRMAHFMEKSYANVSVVQTLEINLTTVQTFLCLAFCELALGNISRAWLLSGMAFRSVQDIGIQYDGQKGRGRDGHSTPNFDSEIRRRIYWGCYTSDSIIALLLGRPAYFQDCDAAVSPSEPLPDNVTLMAWLPGGTEDGQIPHLIPFFNHLGELSKICHQLLLHVFTVRFSLTESSKATVVTLQQFDLSLCKWHNSLDSTLRWNRWSTMTSSTSSHIFLLHLYYLALRLCILEKILSCCGDSSQQDASHKIVDELIEDIAQLLRQCRSSSETFRPSVIMVYAAAVAIHSSRKLASRSEPESAQEHHQARSQVLLRILRECGQACKFAKQVHDQLCPTLSTHGTSLDRRLHRSHQSLEFPSEADGLNRGVICEPIAEVTQQSAQAATDQGLSGSDSLGDLLGGSFDAPFSLQGFGFSLDTFTHPLGEFLL